MRINWNVPERRFFDTGLDQGVLYPKGVAPEGPITATNLIANPTFTNSISGWLTLNGDLTRVVEGATPVADYKVNVQAINQRIYYATDLAVVPGEKIHASFDLKMMVTDSNFRISLGFYTSANALIDTVSTDVLSTSLSKSFYNRVYAVANAPTTGTVAKVRFTIFATLPGGVPVGSGFRIKNAMLTKGTFRVPYFDGSTPDTKVESYGWTGTPNASTSYRRETLTKTVPWFGLQSVDEEGSDGAASYYIDGRPFLFLPRPKEYKATLKAITYPDAFSEIMGVKEIADGLYLDSQMGDSFDLSYRTMVGNATEGIEHGYKIHLVYNCTVSPQSTSYESASDSINPTTFSFEIQAVPVPVEGFRPTAHIIIDTRHMEQSKIDAIEEMLYGSYNDLPHMPSPQVIFDLLSFGDTIIVTDNGDGTFEVTGSYENVYMIEDGVFRVDNVDAFDNGDGTFTMSTTEP